MASLIRLASPGSSLLLLLLATTPLACVRGQPSVQPPSAIPPPCDRTSAVVPVGFSAVTFSCSDWYHCNTTTLPVLPSLFLPSAASRITSEIMLENPTDDIPLLRLFPWVTNLPNFVPPPPWDPDWPVNPIETYYFQPDMNAAWLPDTTCLRSDNAPVPDGASALVANLSCRADYLQIFDNFQDPDFNPVTTFPLLFRPFNDSANACSVEWTVTVRCCSSPQPLKAIFSPYWILVLSSIAYFVASYVLVALVMALERLQCFKRCMFWRTHGKSWEQLSLERDDSMMDFQAAAGAEPAPSAPLSLSARVARANAVFLLLQFGVSLGNFVYIALRFTVYSTEPSLSGRSAWYRYDQVYAVWINSSVVTLLSSAFGSYLVSKLAWWNTLDQAGRLPPRQSSKCCRAVCRCCGCCSTVRRKWERFRGFLALAPLDRTTRTISLVILLTLAPAICTHVIPISVLMFQYFLVAFAVMAGIIVLVYLAYVVLQRFVLHVHSSVQSRGEDKQPSGPAAVNMPTVGAAASPVSPLLSSFDAPPPLVVFPWYALLSVRLVCMIFVVMFVQTSFNCAHLFYAQWLELERFAHWNFEQLMLITPIVFADEYEERDSAKWAASVLNSLHSAIAQLSLFL